MYPVFCDQYTVSVPVAYAMNFIAACCFSLGVEAVMARPEPPVQQPNPAGPSGRKAVPTWNLAAAWCPARPAVESRYDRAAPKSKSVPGFCDAWPIPEVTMERHNSPALTEFGSWIRIVKSGSEYEPP